MPRAKYEEKVGTPVPKTPKTIASTLKKKEGNLETVKN